MAEHDLSKRLDESKAEKPASGVLSAVVGERNFFIVLGVIALILVILIFGFRLFAKEEVKTIDDLHDENLAGKLDPEVGYLHNGFSFVKLNGQWWTRFQRAADEQTYNVQMRYGPRDLIDVPLRGDYVYFLRFNATFVTFDPIGKNLSGTALAAADISQAMVKVFGIAAFPACTRQDNSTCLDLPTIECVPGKPVIYLKQDELPSVEVEGTCIIVHGTGMDMVRAADRLLLAWYGIMP